MWWSSPFLSYYKMCYFWCALLHESEKSEKKTLTTHDLILLSVKGRHINWKYNHLLARIRQHRMFDVSSLSHCVKQKLLLQFGTLNMEPIAHICWVCILSMVGSFFLVLAIWCVHKQNQVLKLESILLRIFSGKQWQNRLTQSLVITLLFTLFPFKTVN